MCINGLVFIFIFNAGFSNAHSNVIQSIWLFCTRIIGSWSMYDPKNKSESNHQWFINSATDVLASDRIFIGIKLTV